MLSEVISNVIDISCQAAAQKADPAVSPGREQTHPTINPQHKHYFMYIWESIPKYNTYLHRFISKLCVQRLLWVQHKLPALNNWLIWIHMFYFFIFKRWKLHCVLKMQQEIATKMQQQDATKTQQDCFDKHFVCQHQLDTNQFQITANQNRVWVELSLQTLLKILK